MMMEPRPPRVLWVTNMFPSPERGVHQGIFVEQQLEALRALGGIQVEVELVAQERGRIDYLVANPRVRRHWRRGDFDLVHVHYGLTGLTTLLLPPRVPIVFTFYGSDVNLAWQRAISRAVAGRARRRIFVAGFLAEKMPSGRNRVLPNGVDFDLFRPRPREEACRALGLDPSRKWVLFGAHPERTVKGFDVFTKVLERVRRRHPQASQLILSEPGQSTPRVVDKLNAADVLLFTSRRGQEGSPMVVKESLAVGLPVVSVNVGDVADMLAGVEPGTVIDWPADPGEEDGWIDRLAEAVGTVLDDPRRADGREKRIFLSQERVAEQILEIYREVLASKE